MNDVSKHDLDGLLRRSGTATLRSRLKPHRNDGRAGVHRYTLELFDGY